MATVGSFSRHDHLAELANPLHTAEGVLSPFTRRRRVLANIGAQLGSAQGARRAPMPTPITQDTTATLTAGNITNGLIVSNPAAAIDLTLPTVANTLANIGNLQDGEAFEFVVLNISTTDTATVTILTNTGWTLVGKMVIVENDSAGLNPFAIFRARRTSSTAMTLYRIG